MSSFYILISVVPHNKADFVSEVATKAGSVGGTVLSGREISSNVFADALGFGGKQRDIVLILSDSQNKEKIFCAIKNECEKEKSGFGYILVLNADSMLKTGILTESEGGDMSLDNHVLISVILNKGYADDAMAAARKAGAGGGTVLNARGTAKEDDAKFFGMHIVPEKEMLLMIVEQEKKAAVLEAIQNLACLKEPGSGIAYSSSVNSFSVLGKK